MRRKGSGTAGMDAAEGSSDLVVEPAEDVIEVGRGTALWQSQPGISRFMARRKGGSAVGVGLAEGGGTAGVGAGLGVGAARRKGGGDAGMGMTEASEDIVEAGWEMVLW